MAYLLIIFVLLLGLSSLASIPKESTPDIKFGIISIGTLYTGVSPADVDSLITTKVEKEIKDLAGIDSIQSTSSLGFSSIVVTLKTDADTSKLLTDIKDAVDKVNLPADAEDPSVVEVSSENELVFSAYLHAQESKVPKDLLYAHANNLIHELEQLPTITSVDIVGSDDYEVQVVLDKEQMRSMSLTPSIVADSIRAYNQNIPLGNFQI